MQSLHASSKIDFKPNITCGVKMLIRRAQNSFRDSCKFQAQNRPFTEMQKMLINIALHERYIF